MTRQQIVAGGYLDIPTDKELSDAVGHRFDAFIRELFRGEVYMSTVGTPTPAPSITIPNFIESGYTWSIKMVSVKLSNATTVPVSVYLGENTLLAPIANGNSIVNGTNNEFVYTWSSNQMVVKDQSALTILCGTGNITAFMIRAEQVITEMQGKI